MVKAMHPHILSSLLLEQDHWSEPTVFRSSKKNYNVLTQVNISTKMVDH